MYVCIYIEREGERERETHTHTYLVPASAVVRPGERGGRSRDERAEDMCVYIYIYIYDI